jgi:hypothetical protein
MDKFAAQVGRLGCDFLISIDARSLAVEFGCKPILDGSGSIFISSVGLGYCVIVFSAFLIMSVIGQMFKGGNAS